MSYEKLGKTFDANRKCVAMSHSTLETLSVCQVKAWREKIQGVYLTNRAALKGRGIDDGMGQGLQAKKNGVMLSASDVIDRSVAAFDAHVAGADGKIGGDEDGDDVPFDEKANATFDTDRDDVARSAGVFWTERVSDLNPHPDFDLQQEVEVKLKDGLGVRAFLDVVVEDEKTGTLVVDLKTAKKKWGPEDHKKKFQPIVYTWAMEQAGTQVDGFGWQILAFNKKEATTDERILLRSEINTKPVIKLLRAGAQLLTNLAAGQDPIPTGFLSGSFLCKQGVCAHAPFCMKELGLPIPAKSVAKSK